MLNAIIKAPRTGLPRRLKSAFQRPFTAVIVTVLLLVSCWSRIENPTNHYAQSSPSHNPITDRPTTPSDIVVLMTLDGVRWQDIFQGIDPLIERRFGAVRHSARQPKEFMPNLYRFAQNGGVLIGDDVKSDGCEQPKYRVSAGVLGNILRAYAKLRQ